MISRARRAHAAVTLLEVLTVFVIIAILGVLAIPVYSKLRARAQRVQCAANLRSLSVAAESFVQQNGMWPQIPPSSGDEAANQQFAQAWINALKPFSATEKNWICPSIQDNLESPDYLQPGNVRIDYYPMPFDDKPITPHQWPRQPWFMETANSHGTGPLIIFTDGSISDLSAIAPPSK